MARQKVTITYERVGRNSAESHAALVRAKIDDLLTILPETINIRITETCEEREVYSG